MRYNLVLIILFFCFSSFHNEENQLITFKSKEDFLNKKGETFDEYRGCLWSGEGVTLLVTNKGVKEKIHCKDMWGFMYKEAVFRVHKEKSIPARLVRSGKMDYYENGVAHLGMLQGEKTSATIDKGYGIYFSKSLDHDLEPLWGNKKHCKKQKEKYPELSEFLDCVTKMVAFLPYQAKPCIDEFEKE